LAKGHPLSGNTVTELDASADAISDGPSADESISISASTRPTLSSGQWYIAVLNLNANDVSVTLTANYEAEDSVPLDRIRIEGPDVVEEGNSATYRLMANWSDGSESVESTDWSIQSSHARIGSDGVLTANAVQADTRVLLRADFNSPGGSTSTSKSITIRNRIDGAPPVALLIEGRERVDEQTEHPFQAQAFWNDGSYSAVNADWLLNSTVATIDDSGLFSAGVVNSDHSVRVNASFTTGGQTLSASKVVTITNIPAKGTGNVVANALWLRAEVHITTDTSVDAVWQGVGNSLLGDGRRLVWGYYHLRSGEADRGSEQSPEMFVTALFDAAGGVTVQYFHLSSVGITVYSDYRRDGTVDESDHLAGNKKFVRHTFAAAGSSCTDADETNQSSCSEAQYENGQPVPSAPAVGNPDGNLLNSGFRLGAMNFRANQQPSEKLWQAGGLGQTPRGDMVVWGFFHGDVTYRPDTDPVIPELFVKLWFDVSGAVYVDWFNASLGHISAFSVYPDAIGYAQKGRTFKNNRYLRHRYNRESALIAVGLPANIALGGTALETSHGSFNLGQISHLGPAQLPLTPTLLPAMHKGVPVAYSFYEPGSGELTFSCLETALSLMIMGNRLFLLPKALIPELKELLEPLPETSQLANAMCAALRQNHRALSPPSSALRTAIRRAEQAAATRVLELVE
jgi:hypothetical protein